MSDDKTEKGSPDNRLISLTEKWEVDYWTKELGLTKAMLKNAIKAAGSHSVKLVREYLKKGKKKAAAKKKAPKKD